VHRPGGDLSIAVDRDGAGARYIKALVVNGKPYGAPYLPESLARKYPNAGREWKWQYLFPAAQLSADPRSGIRRIFFSMLRVPFRLCPVAYTI